MTLRSPPVSTTASRIRPAVFTELQVRIDAVRARGEQLIPLHIGDILVPPPRGVAAAVSAASRDEDELSRYGATTGLPELRDAMAAALARRGLDVDPASEVLVACGATHALFCTARSILDPGDEVVVASPHWPLAPGVFAACGAVPVEAPLSQQLYADPDGDAGALLARAVGPRTKALYFISPNNPDGKVLERRQLERIASLAIDADLWVFADEVYADTVYAPGDAGGAASIATLPGMRERTVVVHSLSKSHAVAGLRVGYAAAPAPVIATAKRVSTHTAYNVAVPMQRAALAALRDESFSPRALAACRAARDAAVRALAGAPFRFHVAEGAAYLFLDFAPIFEGTREARPLVALLERAIDRGVLLAPGDAFGSYPTSARVCFTSAPLPEVTLGLERVCDAARALRDGAP